MMTDLIVFCGALGCALLVVDVAGGLDWLARRRS